MNMDFPTLDTLRKNHPAWRLLRAGSAPLVSAFLNRVFVEPNSRFLAQSDLIEALEDFLFILREERGDDAFPKSAQEYLNDWADDERGWLRKFYPEGQDEPHFELTPATEKALGWLASLTERHFVGTESRLRLLFDLLRQMRDGSQTDPEARVAELEKRRAEIDSEIEQIRAGDMPMMDNTALKDRFQQFMQMSRELLADFREVEHNFRLLDRLVRERIATWEGGKGALLEQIMGERDFISDSDQGRSFQAFWDYLMSPERQDELRVLLAHVLKLSPLEEMESENHLGRIHYDWLDAGEYTQRTVRRLSEQLRRFLDDQAWLENRRIMDLLHQIESGGLEIREIPPKGNFMELSDASVSIELPMERPLFRPPLKSVIEDVELESGEPDVNSSLLFEQIVVDRGELQRHIANSLQSNSQVNLAEVIAQHPLRHGLAELVVYIQMACESPYASVDEETLEWIEWSTQHGRRRAQMPRVLFVRGNT